MADTETMESSGAHAKRDPLPSRILDSVDRLESAGLDGGARALTGVVAAYGRKSLRVAVLGRFSVGKSTLINAFLGYPVLPGGMAPTTGAICRLSFGSPGASVRFKDGRVETFSGPENLPPYLALQPGQSGAAGSGPSIDRVEVTLPLPLLQGGLEIVDLPGLDEHALRTGIATGGLESADIVLFVLAADQLMGEIERRFLVEQVLPRAPGALALVMNFWDRISLTEQPAVIERLQVSAAELGLAINYGISPASETVPLLPLSALQSLRNRWRPRPGAAASDGGIEALEAWLKLQALDAERVKSRAHEGRLKYAVKTGTAEIEGEVAVTVASLRQGEADDVRAAKALAVARGVGDRALQVSGGAADSLLESLSVRIAAGDAALRESIQRRLRKDPFDPLYSLHSEIKIWWNSTLKAVESDAASLLAQVGGILGEAESENLTVDLPSLELKVDPPVPDFRPLRDSAAPVKDTIAGLLGSVSRNAGESAALWMKKASRAAAGLDPQVRRSTDIAVGSLEAAISLAAYSSRDRIRAWAAELGRSVRKLTAARITAAAAGAARQDRAVRDTRQRLASLVELKDEIESLPEAARTGPG